MSTSVWRRYNIFPSSTFKDMDYERDVIKFRVIPALNRRFRDRRVELQAIDLRLGVNTADLSEAESERKVLSVCTSCIDSARPFFIGLIGRRYGWIPPVERWKEFLAGLDEEERELLADAAGCSVTEMEILYGALSQGSFDTSHVLFYLRDDASYEGLPDTLLPTYCDTDPESLRKLEALKTKVQERFGQRGGADDRCTPYRLVWKDGRFSSEDFEALVTEQIARQIEQETAREEEEGAATWWAQEKDLEESTLLRLLPGSVEMELVNEGDDEEDDSADAAVWYVPGFGASTHMAQEYQQWDGDPEVVRLLAVFGLSEYSNAMRPVLVRWIHELAEVTGKDDLPDDSLMLGKMPEPELNDLFASLMDDVRDKGFYVYIYLDDVSALEVTAPKDLYMPWLDRVKDEVNLMANLLDESESREKFLEAHPWITRKMVPLVTCDEDAKAFIDRYEQTYYLELPAGIRKEMIRSQRKKDGVFIPLKVHSVFRLFEALTQEDFAQIRGRKGSQIDAINDYLEQLWQEMPDTPYDLMTFMVNTLTENLGLGEKLRNAIWKIAAAPSGLREADVAFFAAEDWDVVQFYRAMNFLYDFFYEDRVRHLWRAKYLTTPEDGLQGSQRQISEYLLTLDKGDYLRETMGLYYALGGGEPSHFIPYLVEGDYLHGQQMKEIIPIRGPQVRLLAREGFFDKPGFESYCRALEVPHRLQLMIDIFTGLAELLEIRLRLLPRMADWLDDVDIDTLSDVDAFACASILGGRQDSVPMLEKALAAARRSESFGFPTANLLISGLSGLLVTAYQKRGQRAKAEALTKEISGHSAPTAFERFAALQPLLSQAGHRGLLASRKKASAALDRFFTEYYAIVDSLEPNQEGIQARYWSSKQVIAALGFLAQDREMQRLLDELMRFLPSMRHFCRAKGYFRNSEALQSFLYYHAMLSEAAFALAGEPESLGEGESPLQRIGEIAVLATTESGALLKEVDPDFPLGKALRSHRGLFRDNVEDLRKFLGLEDVDIADLDDIIQKEYDSI